MKKLLGLLTTISVLLAGCSSSDNENLAATALVKTAVVSYNATDSETFEYTYDGTKLKTVTRIGDLYMELFYTNDQLTRINYPIDGYYYIIEYNASGKVIRYTKYHSPTDIEEKVEITYSGSNFTRSFYVGNQFNFVGTEVATITNGNLMNLARNFEFSQTTSYTYDNKNNPFKNISNFEVFRIMEINITGTANNATSYTDSVELPYTKQYTYNSSNFPLTEKRMYGNVPYTTTTYTYF